MESRGKQMVVPRQNGLRELNLGIIGCGGVVEGLHLPVLHSIPSVEIKWVCDASANKAKRIARDWGIRQMFIRLSDCSDVDAVLIATPVGTRREILDKTTARGWHALCEKPFARTTSEHREMLASAEKFGVTLGAGFMRRYHWSVQQAKSIVQSNVLGSLIEVVAGESAQLDRTGLDQSSYRNNAQASGGGVLMETGCHLLDEIMFVSNAKTIDVQECDQVFCADYEVDTFASGSIILESGEHVALQFNVSGIRPVFQGITFRCESGEIRLRPSPAKGPEVFVGKTRMYHLELTHPHPTQQHVLAAVRHEWLHFLEMFREPGKKNLQQETGLLTTDAITQCAEMAGTRSQEVQQ